LYSAYEPDYRAVAGFSMNPTKHAAFFLVFTVFVCLNTFWLSGCGKSQETQSSSKEAFSVMIGPLEEYRTNDFRRAYPDMDNAANELSRMAVTNPSKDIPYDLILAQMNARLCVMARKIGDTNAAQRYCEKSVAYYARISKAAGRQPKQYSPEQIEAIVRTLDEELRAPRRID